MVGIWVLMLLIRSTYYQKILNIFMKVWEIKSKLSEVLGYQRIQYKQEVLILSIKQP